MRKMITVIVSMVVFALFVGTATLLAQSKRPHPPHGHKHPPHHKPFSGSEQKRQSGVRKLGGRVHTTTQSSGSVNTVPATESPIADTRIDIYIEGDERVLKGNGIADHNTGRFPNSGNPHQIEEQHYEYRIPAKPRLANRITPLKLGNFGLAVNGVPFDPGAAEWYQGQRGNQWQYEALSGAVRLGLDDNHAHVQPTGAYHYHSLPTLLLESVDVRESQHSPVIGWAADGFPVYALYGANEAGNSIREEHSSYVLKTGYRPSGNQSPGGVYDGTFTADYTYQSGTGTLDECNGRFAITPDFPDGTYAYFLTTAWPVIPRCYKGTPSRDFSRGSPRK